MTQEQRVKHGILCRTCQHMEHHPKDHMLGKCRLTQIWVHGAHNSCKAHHPATKHNYTLRRKT